MLAQLYFGKGDNAKALTATREAERLSPKMPPVVLTLAPVELANGEAEQALSLRRRRCCCKPQLFAAVRIIYTLHSADSQSTGTRAPRTLIAVYDGLAGSGSPAKAVCCARR